MCNSDDDRKKTLCFCAFIMVLASGLLMCCAPNYHIDYYQAPQKRQTLYTSYSFMVSEEKIQNQDILQSIQTGLSNNLQAIGLKDDSHNPELIFIMRWEEHLIRVSSSNSKKSNKRPSESDSSGRYILSSTIDFKKELFIRIQAIDAIRNELLWSVKIYSNQKKGLTTESIPRVVRDLTLSFERVQFNTDKINRP